MAIPMTVFGNTYNDVQSGINAGQALDYQRANQQDQINAQRLSDFLKYRSEQQKNQAQRDEFNAKMLDARLAREMQGRQFETSEANKMALGRESLGTQKDIATAEAKSRLDVAKEGKFDPRSFQSLAEIQALNQQNLQKTQFAKQLSDARKAAVAAKSNLQGYHHLWWNSPEYNDRLSQADNAIKSLDAQAAALGIANAPDGGYVIPDFVPITVPAMLRGGSAAAGSSVGTPDSGVSAPAPIRQFYTPSPQGGIVNLNLPPVVASPAPAMIAPAQPIINRFRFDPSLGGLIPQQ